MDIHIRAATPQDYEAVLPLFDEIDAPHRQHHPERFQEPQGPARERDYFLAVLADERHGFFVAEINSELAGFVHVIMQETSPFPIVRPRRFAQLDAIVVKTAYRSQGVGHLLMAQADTYARAHGAESIELGVYEFNRDAQDFYRGLGYTTFCRRMGKRLDES
jgi:ribosomal protein S18 acetylase RimI-like enzyme